MAINDFSQAPWGNGRPKVYLGTAVPSNGAYNQGDIIWNSAPSITSPAGWICTTGGTDATVVFAQFGMAGGGAELTTTATSGTLSSAYSMILLNPASTGTYSLPNVTAFSAGSTLFIKNIASGSTTLTPLGANNYEATSIAAITLAQNARVTLRSGGTTTWYLQGT